MTLAAFLRLTRRGPVLVVPTGFLPLLAFCLVTLSRPVWEEPTKSPHCYAAHQDTVAGWTLQLITITGKSYRLRNRTQARKTCKTKQE